MAGSSGELKNLKDEVSGLKEDVAQIKGLLEQIVKVSIKDEKMPRIAVVSPGTCQPAGNKTVLPSPQSGKKTTKYEIDVLQFQQLVESSPKIPGLLKAIINDDGEKCMKILRKSLKINSPEYKELMEIKNSSWYGLITTNVLVKATKYSLIHLIAVFLKNEVSVSEHLNWSSSRHLNGSDKKTMLHVAAEYGQYELVKLLLSMGASVNAKDSEMNTPLHFAAHCNHPHIVEVLLENGANIDAVNKHHQTPLMVFHNAVQKSYKYKNTNEYPIAKIINKYDLDRLDKKKY